MEEQTASPVIALRESFGHGKPPDISRKITACVACRKQKIKCNKRDAEAPCARCKKRGLSCTVNRSLQMLLESDAAWKHSTEKKLQMMRLAMEKVGQHLSLPDLLDHSLITPDLRGVYDTPRVDSQLNSPAKAESHQPHNWEIVMDPDSGPAAIPGSCVSEIQTVALPPLDRSAQDLISRGVITIASAQRYFDIYQKRLDHFLYRILGDRTTLTAVRSASPLLTAATCTVGALHAASHEFDACYQEFVSISAAQMFSRKNTIDEVRGLCIGAFWLSGISWTLVGAAVRIATEIQLHRSIFKALDGDRAHYMRTRVYYLVYVCDHHFSIVYGRPPLTRQDEAIQAYLKFLDCEHATEDDARLVSQVQFWTIGSGIYETFGIDAEKPLSDALVPHLRRYSISLDACRADWTERFSHNEHVGNYPRKGVGLHYHFMKLYLCSHVFRGIGRPGFRSENIALESDELANSAILHAESILRTVLSDEEIQSHLNGLATYFDIMIAFAVIFLLKVATKFSALVRVDTSEIERLVRELVAVLKRVTAPMHPRHLLVSIATGIESLLGRCFPAAQSSHLAEPCTGTQQMTDDGLHGMMKNTNNEPWDDFFMGEFDFLSSQDPMTNFPLDFQLDNMT